MTTNEQFHYPVKPVASPARIWGLVYIMLWFPEVHTVYIVKMPSLFPEAQKGANCEHYDEASPMGDRVLTIVFNFLYYILSARLNFPAEKATFRIQDNPLIHALDEKLQTAQTSSIKLLFDYLKSEEYRE